MNALTTILKSSIDSVHLNIIGRPTNILKGLQRQRQHYERVAALERKLAQQDERIRQLFAQQLAEPHEDVSSSYIVLDEVWHKVGKDAAAERGMDSHPPSESYCRGI